MPTSVRTTVPAVCTARQKLQLLHCDVSLSRNHGRTCSLSPCGYGVQRRPPFLLLVAQDQPAPQPQPHTPPCVWPGPWPGPGSQPGSQSGASTMHLPGLYIRALTGVPARDHAAGFRIQDQLREAARGARTGANSKSTAHCSRPPGIRHLGRKMAG